MQENQQEHARYSLSTLVQHVGFWQHCTSQRANIGLIVAGERRRVNCWSFWCSQWGSLRAIGSAKQNQQHPGPHWETLILYLKNWSVDVGNYFNMTFLLSWNYHIAGKWSFITTNRSRTFWYFFEDIRSHPTEKRHPNRQNRTLRTEFQTQQHMKNKQNRVWQKQTIIIITIQNLASNNNPKNPTFESQPEKHIHTHHTVHMLVSHLNTFWLSTHLARRPVRWVTDPWRPSQPGTAFSVFRK